MIAAAGPRHTSRGLRLLALLRRSIHILRARMLRGGPRVARSTYIAPGSASVRTE